MRFPPVEAEVGNDQLPFEVRHQQQPEDQRIEVAQFRSIDSGKDLRLRVEREFIFRGAEDTSQHGGDEQVFNHAAHLLVALNIGELVGGEESFA